MAFESHQRGYSVSVGRSAAEVDAGLRAYMLRVYNYMASALALTGIVALAVSSSPALMQTIFGSGLGIVVMLAPVGLVLFLSFGINKMSLTTAQAVFWIYAALMGVSLSSIFLAYTGESIARTFFITAGTFAGMSLYGYTTKKDLSGWGSFLFMGLIGIIIASVVNLFLHSSALQFVVSAAGVLIFTGLTAYDTQRIKESYYEGDGAVVAGKKAVFGALQLYLDFINLFIMLLRFFGNRN
jgi:FtsH-binding integral membrane protein